MKAINISVRETGRADEGQLRFPFVCLYLLTCIYSMDAALSWRDNVIRVIRPISNLAKRNASMESCCPYEHANRLCVLTANRHILQREIFNDGR